MPRLPGGALSLELGVWSTLVRPLLVPSAVIFPPELVLTLALTLVLVLVQKVGLGWVLALAQGQELLRAPAQVSAQVQR